MRLVLRLLLALVFLLPPAALAEPIDLPYRQQNWAQGCGGSCVHCAIIVLLYEAGQTDLARAWFYAYNGGESSRSTHEKLQKAQIPFAATDMADDIGFLEWAMENRLPCGVAVANRSHMIVLVELTDEIATLVDPNFPEKNRVVPRSEFIAEWLNSGSWAFCLLLKPYQPRGES